MRRKGRPPAWTPEERERVLTLAEGVPQRAIAEAVFGDARYRGRVERILRSRDTVWAAPSLPRMPDTSESEDELVLDSTLQTLKEVVARYERSLAASREAPSLADIERLLRIKRQLESWEMLEQMRALWRNRE